MSSYYSILGVSHDATIEQIKHNYRKLATIYHPDKNNGDGSMFRKVNKAYQILSDSHIREKYDRFLADGGHHSRSKSKQEIVPTFFPLNGMMDIRDAFRQFDDIFNNFPKDSKRSTYSYSSSYVTQPDKDGNYVTKQKVLVNKNGKEDQYYKVSTVDKDGNERVLKQRGNPNIKLLTHKK